MTEKIEEILKKLAAATPSGKTPAKSEAQSMQKPGSRSKSTLPGDPACPICRGVGYYRLDLPLDHQDFGKVQICACLEQQVRQQVYERLFSFSQLRELSHLTFDNFKPRGKVGNPPLKADSIERAYNQARQYAGKLQGWLLLLGGYGCGKTHLAAAIANFTVSLGVPTLFITVPDLLDGLRYTSQNLESNYEDRLDQIRTIPLLVLDDFGTQNATAWAQEKLFQIINFRYINRLPLVVTSNLSLGLIEERIRSRLSDPELVTVVKIDAPDYRQPVGDIGYHELSSLDLLHELTFANFSLRKNEGMDAAAAKSLERAFQAARQFAENPRDWLVLSGPTFCGKTHLAAAIANYRADLGYPHIFVSVPDLLDHLRATFAPYSNASLDQRFYEVRTTPLLILDDLGAQASSPWAREKLYQLFDHRYFGRLPTVITTSTFRDEMDARLLSRMEDTRYCTICAITAPPFRAAMAETPSPKRGRKRRE